MKIFHQTKVLSNISVKSFGMDSLLFIHFLVAKYESTMLKGNENSKIVKSVLMNTNTFKAVAAQSGVLDLHIRLGVKEKHAVFGNEMEDAKVPFIDALIKDLSALMDDTELADFQITCVTETFACHKAILAARSSYFKGLIESPMKESCSG